MSDVFVSYKAEDRKRIRPLVEALQAEGFSVWWDEQIGGGSAWRQAIETELNAAKCVVVVWSNRSVGPEGTFVQDEATRAQQRHVYVPVLIDKVHLPLGFGETQALPLTGWRGNRSDPRYEAVLAAVRRNVGGSKRKPAAAPLPASSVDRRTVIAGGAVAAVAVAGAGAWALLKPISAGAASDSIAVLPFSNLSGDPAQEYFSDGIAEEIRGALTRVAGLKVAGSTSSEAVRNDDAQTAAKKLSVSNILTGSVRQSPSTIRVSAELIDGRTGLDKWSQDYDRDPGDAIKIQTDIAQNVASALSAALGSAAMAAVTVGGTSNSAAQDLFLKAKAQLKRDDSEDSLRKILGLVDSAITLDPKFADAYALKAQTMASLVGYYSNLHGHWASAFDEAAAVARKAVSLAPNVAGAHMTLAYIEIWQLDIGRAWTDFQRGNALRGDADDVLRYAYFLNVLGRHDEAVAAARKAEASDPLNPDAYANEAGAQFNAGRMAQAEAAYRRSLALAPEKQRIRGFFADTLMEQRKFDEAAAEFRKMPADHLFRLVGEAVMFARQGNRAASDAVLQRARQVFGEDAIYQYAEIYAQRGENDLALAALERAWSFRDPGLATLKTDIWMAPLRKEPRFTALLQKMNFPA